MAIGILHTFQPNLFSNPGGLSMYTSSYKSIGESIPHQSQFSAKKLEYVTWCEGVGLDS